MQELAADVAARLEIEATHNGRVPTQLVASLRTEDDVGNKWAAARSKRSPLRGGGMELLVKEGLALLLRLADGRPKARGDGVVHCIVCTASYYALHVCITRSIHTARHTLLGAARHHARLDHR